MQPQPRTHSETAKTLHHQVAQIEAHGYTHEQAIAIVSHHHQISSARLTALLARKPERKL
jgi:hypothetical protein